MEKDTPIPTDVKALSGCNIRISGFMLPMDGSENITEFALVTTLYRPGPWPQPPPVQQVVVVNCPGTMAVTFSADRIVVEGKLTVKVVKDEGFVVSIFGLDCTSVKPADKK